MSIIASHVIEIDASGAIVNVRKLGQELDNTANQTGKAVKVTDSFKNTLGSLKSAVTAIGPALAAMGIGYTVKSFIDAASTAENYQLRLKILLGSVEEGNRLFQNMSKYAAQVPFEFQKIMGAATSLSGVMKGGVDEVSKWMPLIGDLAAATGLGIEETTSQVIRMYSAGAASADLFRERGVLAMLGFQAGVSYSAEETRKMLMEAWESPTSKFKGATEEMKNSWTGLTSMASDAWNQFERLVMNTGIFNFMKAGLNEITESLKEINKVIEDPKGFWKSYIEKLQSNPMTADNWLTRQLENFTGASNTKTLKYTNPFTIVVRKDGLPAGAESSTQIAPDDAMQQQIENNNKAIRESTQVTKEFDAAWEKFNKTTFENFEDAKMDLMFNTISTSVGQLKLNLKETTPEAKALYDELINKERTWYEQHEQLVSSWADRFTDAFMNINKKGKEAFADLFESIGQDMARMFIKQQITNPIFSALTGLDIFGGESSGKSSTAQVRAMGGPAYAGRSYMVGENGPEIITMGGGGYVSPKMAVNVQIIDKRSSDAPAVQIQQGQGLDGNATLKIVIDKVAESIGTGGNINSAMEQVYGLTRRGY